MNDLDALQAALLSYDGPLVKVLLAMSMLRLIFKPLMHYLADYIASTPSHFDDEIYAQVTSSAIYRTLSFALDLLASIKLPPVAENPEEKK
jgi:hypothetical protein